MSIAKKEKKLIFDLDHRFEYNVVNLFICFHLI